MKDIMKDIILMLASDRCINFNFHAASESPESFSEDVIILLKQSENIS